MLSEKNKKIKIKIENKVNLILAFKLYLSSIYPTKKNSVEKIKNMKKLKLSK